MSTSLELRDFSVNGRKSDKAKAESGPRWWQRDAKDDAGIANAIAADVEFLVQHQAARFSQHIISARLYGNLSLSGIHGVDGRAASALQSALRERIQYNLTQSVIDTATAKIGENKPKPFFLTSGGTHKDQRKAKDLNKFTEGIFYENQAYDLGGEAQRDAEVWGDGLIFVSAKHQRVTFERVLSSELLVDEAEATYGNPRTMYRVKPVDRGVLKGFFPDSVDIIERANAPGGDRTSSETTVADIVQVREAWHLPSGPNAKDGKHCISIDGHLLAPVDVWPHDFFPFARWRWAPRPYGYWSQGLAEQLQPIQIWLNKLLWLMQRSIHLGASFKLMLPNGSKVVKEHVNNEVGGIISYNGDKRPDYVLPPTLQPEVYQEIETTIRRGYELGGITSLSATGRKPEGLNSGRALREYKDETNERFKTQGRYNERGYLDLARMAIATAKEIAANNGGHYEVSVPGKKFLASIDWKDINLEEDQYTMQCFPVSSLPSDPAGRLQTIQEYIQAGMLTPRQGKRLLDFPDLEQVESLQSAQEDLLTKSLDDICDGEDMVPPDPTDDLQLAKELVIEYIQRGRAQQLDEALLDKLRQWSSQVDALVQLATPPPAPPPVGASPQAQPAPQPVSDLVPNAPGMTPPPPGVA